MPTNQQGQSPASVAQRLSNPTGTGSTPGQPELPSITGYLKTPAVKKYAIIGSFVMNLLLFIALIGSLGGDDSQPATRPVIVQPTEATTVTRPTPTNNPSQQDNFLQNCFKNCEKKELLEALREEVEKVSDIKAVITYTDLPTNNCYGIQLLSSSSGKQSSYHLKSNLCSNSTLNIIPNNTIRIAGNSYVESSNNLWDIGTAIPLARSHLESTVLELLQQQDVSVSDSIRGETPIKIITGESSQINDFGQLITSTVTAEINDEFKVLKYEVNKPGVKIETGSYFDYDVENSIEAPI